MPNIEEYISCPFCHSRLHLFDTECECAGCGQKFPIIAGIPDLRVPVENDWLDFDKDRAFAAELAEKYDSMSFAQMVAEVWNRRQNVPPEIVEKRIKQIEQGAAKFAQNLSEQGWIGSHLAKTSEKICLELGCGTGGFLEAAIPEFHLAVGVDISLTWLVVTKKRLQEKGLNGAVVCACIERLPFAADRFDCVTAFDVIEHIADPQCVAAETRRVIRSGGAAFFTTPNRYSLSAEPHVGIWGVGFLPRRWMRSYVRWRNGMIYQGTYPRSLLDLRRLFSRQSRIDLSIETPTIWEPEVASFPPLKRAAAQIYNRIIRAGFVRFAILPIAPFFQITVRKSEDD